MAEIIIKFLVAILLLLGLVDLFRGLLFWMLKTKKSGKIIFVVEVEGHDREAELRLRNAVEKMKWVGGREKKRVLCVDRGMDEETAGVCRMLAANEPMVTLCLPEELPNIIEQ